VAAEMLAQAVRKRLPRKRKRSGSMFGIELNIEATEHRSQVLFDLRF
jgi:hypothetical protein